MPAIYEPRGPAREYAALAINVYAGCTHGCRYCYVPGVVRRPREEFWDSAKPRPGIVEAVRREAPKYRGDPREILLSFTSDPYQPAELEHHATRDVLEILARNKCRATVLTKSPWLAVELDYELFQEGKFSLGTTLVFPPGQTDRQNEWEPGAPDSTSRLRGLQAAKDQGLRTWVSLEPVIVPAYTLEIISIGLRSGLVDHWKVGKLNHYPMREEGIDWREFTHDAIELLEEAGASYYLKKSLRPYAPEGWKPQKQEEGNR